MKSSRKNRNFIERRNSPEINEKDYDIHVFQVSGGEHRSNDQKQPARSPDLYY
jgi:hypothetical protein